MNWINEELNYRNDPRVRAADDDGAFEVVSERGSKLVIRLDEVLVESLIEDGKRPVEFDGTLEVDFAYVVCPLCQGRGKHTNPSIDCCGLTSEDFDDDPDFRENYMNGVYDVTCARCHGQRVVPDAKLPDDVREAVKVMRADLEELHRMEMAELRMGA